MGDLLEGYELVRAWDEMFSGARSPRPHYEALHQVLGRRPPAVTSIKRVMGHGSGAAGAFEAVAAARTIATGLVPSLGTDVDPDPALDLDLVVGPPRRVEPGPVLSTSLGLGGANGAVVLGPVEPRR